MKLKLVWGLGVGAWCLASAAASPPANGSTNASPAPAPAIAMAVTMADRPTYLAEICAQLQAAWPTNRTITIICHGHSVPAGYFKTPTVDTFNAYPHLLHVGLKQRFPHAVINLIVTAIGGENAEQGAKRFRNEVLNHRPDVVTIDYALNDRGLGLARAEAAWRSMIEQAQGAGARVLLLTPTPDQNARLDDPSDPLNQHAAMIRRLAAEYHVGLADSLKRFEETIHAGIPLASLMSQSNHPNRQGHDLVTAELLSWFP